MEKQDKAYKEKAIRYIENYIKWRKLKKEAVWDAFDLIHLSHKGETWKSWLWDDLAEDNKISDEALKFAESIEIAVRVFNIQIEDIKNCSRLKKGGLNSSQP